MRLDPGLMDFLKRFFVSRFSPSTIAATLSPADDSGVVDLGEPHRKFGSIYANRLFVDGLSVWNADQVDGIHAYDEPAPNSLLALSSDSDFPDSVYPNAILMDGSRALDSHLDFTELSSSPSSPASGKVRVWQENGELFVKDSSANVKKLDVHSLNDLSNVSTGTPSHQSILYYNGTVTTWQSSTVAALDSRSWQTVFTVEGDLAVGTGKLRIPNVTGRTLTISKVYLIVATAPTGAAIIVDIHKNGTTIFTTQANRPQIAASSTTGNTTTINVSSWGDGDYLTMDIDQVGSTVKGADLTCVIVWK